MSSNNSNNYNNSNSNRFDDRFEQKKFYRNKGKFDNFYKNNHQKYTNYDKEDSNTDRFNKKYHYSKKFHDYKKDDSENRSYNKGFCNKDYQKLPPSEFHSQNEYSKEKFFQKKSQNFNKSDYFEDQNIDHSHQYKSHKGYYGPKHKRPYNKFYSKTHQQYKDKQFYNKRNGEKSNYVSEYDQRRNDRKHGPSITNNLMKKEPLPEIENETEKRIDEIDKEIESIEAIVAKAVEEVDNFNQQEQILKAEMSGDKLYDSKRRKTKLIWISHLNTPYEDNIQEIYYENGQNAYLSHSLVFKQAKLSCTNLKKENKGIVFSEDYNNIVSKLSSPRSLSIEWLNTQKKNTEKVKSNFAVLAKKNFEINFKIKDNLFNIMQSDYLRLKAHDNAIIDEYKENRRIYLEFIKDREGTCVNLKRSEEPPLIVNDKVFELMDDTDNQWLGPLETSYVMIDRDYFTNKMAPTPPMVRHPEYLWKRRDRFKEKPLKIENPELEVLLAMKRHSYWDETCKKKFRESYHEHMNKALKDQDQSLFKNFFSIAKDIEGKSRFEVVDYYYMNKIQKKWDKEYYKFARKYYSKYY
eukprot:TRINITY_DN2780_c0_g1_i2.p1 TRINITY_DN2780_c0_g1~~TRINITY_DN2780_c0_g1_i2.p1  ORF type:complete len:577 (+),score=131.30 TRINITY_DN2780_c0_g1_i2:240-1970(+)